MLGVATIRDGRGRRRARPGAGPRVLPHLINLGAGAAVFAVNLLLVSHGATVGLSRGGRWDPVHIALLALVSLPLVAWRRFPLTVFAATAVGSGVLAAIGTVVWPVGPATALYLLSTRRDAAAWTRRTTGILALLLVGYFGSVAAAAGMSSDLFHAVLACAAAWFAGERVRLRREQIRELRDRAALAEQEAARDRQLAVAEERARIARDLHDSAGHALNVIAVRAGTARLRRDDDPGRAHVILEEIEELARQTAAEIDRFVGTLRADDEPGNDVETPAGLASVDALVAQREAAGLRVVVTRAAAGPPLTAALDQAAYRILQEALTNAARHGTGTAAVELRAGDDALEVSVTNPIAPNRDARPVRGHGLIGMRERVNLLGGQFRATADHDRFVVSARLPYAGRP